MLREIQIIAVLNGFVVRCGCQSLVFTSRDEMFTALKDYYDDPEKTEKRFLASGINRKHTYGDVSCVKACQTAEMPSSPPNY